MNNTLDFYDTRRLKLLLDSLIAMADYNYVPNSPLTNKLNTIIKKIEKVIDDYGEDEN